MQYRAFFGGFSFQRRSAGREAAPAPIRAKLRKRKTGTPSAHIMSHGQKRKKTQTGTAAHSGRTDAVRSRVRFLHGLFPQQHRADRHGKRGGLEYEDLFSVVRDSEDNVEMVQANSPEINMIAREIANLAQANLDELGLREISIPIGTFTGLALLMGIGPDVTISVMPIGSALCDFVSYFTAAGINQTLHKIYIDVHAVVNIITPIDEPTITVKAEVLVAENLIVGDVPQFYFGGAVENGGFLDLTP